MIEWVPIKEFKITEEKFLVLIVGKNFEQVCQAKKHLDGGHCLYANDYGYFSPLGTPNYAGLGAKITHAAKINLPVEKTLEGKVADYLAEINVVTETKRDIVFNVIKIAKQHYEGGSNDREIDLRTATTRKGAN